MKKLLELKKELIEKEGCATYLMGCAFRGAILATEKLAEVEETLEGAHAGKKALTFEYEKVLKLKEFFKHELAELTTIL